MFLFVGFPGTGIDPAAHPPKCLPDETALDVGPRTLLQVLPDYLHGAHLKATQGHCRWGDGFTFSPPRCMRRGCTAVMAIKRPVKRCALQSAHEYP